MRCYLFGLASGFFMSNLASMSIDYLTNKICGCVIQACLFTIATLASALVANHVAACGGRKKSSPYQEI